MSSDSTPVGAVEVSAPDPALPRYSDHVRGDRPAVANARRPWWPSALLMIIGLVLVVAPVAGGMFYPAAQGQQMIGQFGPYVQAETLESFRADLQLLERARLESAAVNNELGTGAQEYQLVAAFVRDYPDIDAEITAMLDGIDSGRSDFARLESVQPLSLIPFVPLLAGFALVLVGGWGIRRSVRGASARPVIAVGAAVAIVVGLTPVIGGWVGDTRAADPLLERFESVLTEQQVRAVQSDFVVLVGAIGDMDSGYVDAAHTRGIPTPAIDELGTRWQPMSSDFAGLIGTMNDNLENYSGVAELNDKTRSLGFGAFAALPWFVIGAALATLAALAAQGVRPARRVSPDTNPEGNR